VNESVFLGKEIEKVKEELYLVLDNLRNLMKFYGIIEGDEEKNVDTMMEKLSFCVS
jgi:hypothetical protein